MEVATGSHQLKITNYSQTKLIAVGMHFTSAPFSIGGCTWAIHYYPGGAKKFHESYISLGLSLCHGPKTANFRGTDIARSIIEPQCELRQQLGHLLASGLGSDITFEVEGQTFRAHKCVLAASSPVFRAELFGPAMGKQLLAVADRFGLDRMKSTCEFLLCRDLDVERLSSALVLAEQHNCKQLKAASLKYVTSQRILIPVMATDGFKHLVESCPWMLQEINASYSHETTNDDIRFGLTTLLLALCVLWIVAMYFALLFGKI
ncbi:hypothetical protein LUZ63_009987 [Rhynchospora breviuscula]|uniref:BTB domain-containing protein n=1 Tax=Rhynchospora breviuscula TaxID=2022672 RepID=A0A9Q0CGX6_9POAL|nr:hypothetical protein LUZ63_009987 [Rhynchospora breviuscula]